MPNFHGFPAISFIVLFLLLVLPCTSSSPSSPRGDCLTDRNCSLNEKCVSRHCFHRNEHVFKCVGDVSCPEFHVCRNGVCLMEKKSGQRKRRNFKKVHVRSTDKHKFLYN